MDLSNPALLFSSFVVSTIGVGLFLYGKRAGRAPCLGVGAALCVFPPFVHSVWLLWGLTALLLAALPLLQRWT